MFGFFSLTNRHNKKIRGRILTPVGEKPLIVFVHGLGGGMFEPQYRVLKKIFHQAGYGVCMFDMVNSLGRSSLDPSHLSIDEYYDDMREVLKYVESKGFSKLVLFGHSMGGGLVIRYLATQPTDVIGGVLLNPFVSHYGTTFDHLTTTMSILEKIFKKKLQAFVPSNESVTSFLEFDTIPQASLIRTPLLVMRGAYDRVISQESVDALVSALSVPVVKKTYDYFGHTMLHKESLKKIHQWAHDVLLWTQLLEEKK